MVVYLIAGLPASGKDTLAEVLSRANSHKVLSLSRDILTPLQEDPFFRQSVSQQSKVDFSFLPSQSYPPGRTGLIQFADDLNSFLLRWNYFHFVDLAYVMYGPNLIIPSFRQTVMLNYLRSHAIPHQTILIECDQKTRYQRWISRDSLSLREMQAQDHIEKNKYLGPLCRSVSFDHYVDNSGSISELEATVKRILL